MGLTVAHAVLGTGARLASTVYGTVVVMATLTAAYASQKDPWKLALIVAVTTVVLWIAHLYAHTLARAITGGRRPSLGELGSIAVAEVGIVLAAVAPILMLVVGALALIEESRAVWLALAVGLVTLAVEGVRFARIERLGRTGMLVVVAGNLALGSLVVGLKVVITH